MFLYKNDFFFLVISFIVINRHTSDFRKLGGSQKTTLRWIILTPKELRRTFPFKKENMHYCRSERNHSNNLKFSWLTMGKHNKSMCCGFPPGWIITYHNSLRTSKAHHTHTHTPHHAHIPHANTHTLDTDAHTQAHAHHIHTTHVHTNINTP